MTTWKVLIATDIFKSDSTNLLCPVDTLIKSDRGVFTVNGEVVIITSEQIKQNPAVYELQAPEFELDEVTYGGKSIHIKFMINVPALSKDDKATLGVIVQTWLNNKDG